MLDGERIYADMDKQNMGFISINNFANWICDNCGFHICDEDLPGLETVLDGSNDYRITREGFIEVVSVPPDDEEGDNLGASFKASSTPNRNSSTFKQANNNASTNMFGMEVNNNNNSAANYGSNQQQQQKSGSSKKQFNASASAGKSGSAGKFGSSSKQALPHEYN